MKYVTARSNHPANVIFEVVNRSRNGWLTCHARFDQRGKQLAADRPFFFRVSDMREATAVEFPFLPS